jgi:hypothetical protein
MLLEGDSEVNPSSYYWIKISVIAWLMVSFSLFAETDVHKAVREESECKRLIK